MQKMGIKGSIIMAADHSLPVANRPEPGHARTVPVLDYCMLKISVALF